MITLALLLAPAIASPLPLKGGVGVFFHGAGTFLDQPDQNEVDGFLVPAQGWGGFGAGGGVALELRAFDAVGVEFDVIRRVDAASSSFTLNNVEYPFDASQPAWHLPVLFKAGLPTGVVRPHLVGGGLWVIPGDATITQKVILLK